MGTDKNMSTGSTALLLLQLLTRKDMYGYEMIEALRRDSEEIFQLKTGTLYPLLHALEMEGCLTSYLDDTEKRPKKYYHITRKGRKRLEQKRKEWKEYSGAVERVLNGGSYEC